MTQIQNNVLPQSAPMALQEMLRITSSVLDASQKESQAIAMGDLMGFTLIQGDKEIIVGKYVKAGEEFRRRAQEFKGMGAIGLDKLKSLQEELAHVAKANNKIVAPIAERIKTKIAIQQEKVGANDK